MHAFITPLFVVLATMTALLPARTQARAHGYIEIAQATVDACEKTDDAVTCEAELVAFARFESDFTRGAIGLQGEIGPWQIKPSHLPKGEKTPLPEQAEVAARLIAESKAACAGNAPDDRAARYTSGDCRFGKAESRDRLGLAAWLLRGRQDEAGAAELLEALARRGARNHHARLAAARTK